MGDEYERITAALAGLDGEWRAREEALRKLQGRLAEGRPDAFDFLNHKGAKLLALQLSDLRSGIVKVASEAVQAASAAKSASKTLSLTAFAEGFMREAPLFKGIGCANKLISGYACAALVGLFEVGAVPASALEGFFNAWKAHKNPQIRETAARCLAVYASKPRRAPDASDLFKRAGEFFMRDAVAAVRAQAKRIKTGSSSSMTTLLSDNVEHSRDTADESEPVSLRRPSAPAPQWEALGDALLPADQQLRVLRQLLSRKSSRSLSLEAFSAMSACLARTGSAELRRELTQALQRAEYGQAELVEAAAEAGAGLVPALDFLLPLVVRGVQPEECLGVFAARNDLGSLRLLKARLEGERVEARVLAGLGQTLCLNLVSEETPAALRALCAETLAMLALQPGFGRWAAQHENFQSAAAVVGRLGVEGASRLAHLLQPARPKTPSLEFLHRRFRAAGKEERDCVAQEVVELGDPAALYALFLRLIAAEQSSSEEIVDALKLMIAVLKVAQTEAVFVRETRRRLEETVSQVRDCIFSHAEVMVRKTTVHFLVCLFHVVGEEDFARAVVAFAPEQQRLIQVYVKKSLE